MQSLRSRNAWSVTRLFRHGWVGLLALLLAGCHFDMYNQPKDKTYDPSSFFADGRGSRPNVPGAIVANGAQTDAYLNTGLINGATADVMPFPVTPALLARGQAQFNIFCAVCHGEAGNGESAVANRGGVIPANFHQPRLRSVPVSHFFVTITNGIYRTDPATNGYQTMFSYAARIKAEDRWAIAAYIRALQLSQNATLDDVPLAQRATFGQ